jgi:hypothetical protein
MFVASGLGLHLLFGLLFVGELEEVEVSVRHHHVLRLTYWGAAFMGEGL